MLDYVQQTEKWSSTEYAFKQDGPQGRKYDDANDNNNNNNNNNNSVLTSLFLGANYVVK